MKKSNYDLVKKIVEAYEDGGVLNDFEQEFEVGSNISKSKFMRFFSKYIDDMSEVDYIKLNWEYVKSGGDDSVFYGI